MRQTLKQIKEKSCNFIFLKLINEIFTSLYCSIVFNLLATSVSTDGNVDEFPSLRNDIKTNFSCLFVLFF